MLAYDEETGEQAYKPVVQLFRNESKDWTGVTVDGKETISTPGHKYYLPESKTWVSAEELKVGDEVLTSEGKRAIIKAVRPIHYKTPQTTYNFEVADFHTYYVSIGVLVHNEGCYTYENGVYEDASYHGKKSNGRKSPRPIDGQAALDNSVQIKHESPRRLGYSEGQLVVLDQTQIKVVNNIEVPIFHGHVRTYSQLRTDMKNIARICFGIRK